MGHLETKHAPSKESQSEKNSSLHSLCLGWEGEGGVRGKGWVGQKEKKRGGPDFLNQSDLSFGVSFPNG